jgi:hypothetical protein
VTTSCEPPLIVLIKSSTALFELTTRSLENAIAQLRNVALVGRAQNTLTIHRLLQQSIFHRTDLADIQQAFDAAAKLVNYAFPKQVNGRPLLDKWEKCEVVVQHAMTLAQRFKQAKRKRARRLTASSELRELMKNCVW